MGFPFVRHVTLIMWRMNGSDKLDEVLSSPLEGLICVERHLRKGASVPDKESRQDVWIQTLLSDLASLNGELFGRNGNGGFVGEMRTGMARMESKQDRLQEQLGRLQKEMAENKISVEDQLIAVNGKADQAHARLDVFEPRLRTVEEQSGVRAQRAITVVLKAAAVAVIGGAVGYFLF